MLLECKDLEFSYSNSKEKIISNVSLSIGHQERVAILGPSGFGKTTLCKILSGYLHPQGGDVYLDGKPILQKGYYPVQMIWQHPEKAINPRLKLRDTLADGDEVEDRISYELGIEPDWMNRYPQELSGGELQRFCIARALGKRTKFLIADEISTMLDLITQSQIWKFLTKEVHDREIGLIMVSHSDDLIKQVATRTIELSDTEKYIDKPLQSMV